MSGARVFDKLVEKATSPLLLEIDWESILKMCDLIRQGDVASKYAVSQIKKKMGHENIHVVNYSLQCIESMVKNCGSKVHQEIATKDFMDLMRGIAGTKSDPVKTKVLELVQCWSHAFKKNPSYKIVEDYYNSMKLEGFQYPPLKESEAMFDVEEAPTWIEDSETTNCYRCRVEFSTLRRRHHCRACGQIFCNACSSKTSPIPKFGIEKEVRVCDVCYDKIRLNNPNGLVGALTTSGSANKLKPEDDLPIEYVNSPLFKEGQKEATKKTSVKTEEEFQEELQLALALSQSEAEAAQASKRKTVNGSSALNGQKSKDSTSQNQKQQSNYESSSKSKSEPKGLSYLSNETNGSFSSASAPYAETVQSNQGEKQHQEALKQNSTHNEEEDRVDREMDEFVSETRQILELYINRMKSDSIRGRSITNDTAVQSMFIQLQHLHPKLLSYIKYLEDARGYYESLQDKLCQLKDAREALNALRQENFEKKRREQEEMERLRQLQISQKLQHMRQQKQNYYFIQNQLNLQRLQEQERDLQMRLNQQRELVMQRDQQFYSPSGLLFKSPSQGENLQDQQKFVPNGQQDFSAQSMLNPNAMPFVGATNATFPQSNPQFQMNQPRMSNGNLPGMVASNPPIQGGYQMPNGTTPQNGYLNQSNQAKGYNMNFVDSQMQSLQLQPQPPQQQPSVPVQMQPAFISQAALNQFNPVPDSVHVQQSGTWQQQHQQQQLPQVSMSNPNMGQLMNQSQAQPQMLPYQQQPAPIEVQPPKEAQLISFD